MTTYTQPTEYRNTVTSIMQRLPVERLASLADYARFLESQENSSVDDGDAKWDALLASPKGKAILYQLADQAEAEIDAGRTTEIGFTDDGRLNPA